MKKITLIVLVLLLLSILVGCLVPEPIASETVTHKLIINYRNSGISGTGVYRFIDKDAGVVCWISGIGYAYSISCLPIKDTLLH